MEKNTREVVDGILKVGAGITFVYGLAATIVGAALVSNTDAYQEKVEVAKVQPTTEYVQTLNESDDIVKNLETEAMIIDQFEQSQAQIANAEQAKEKYMNSTAQLKAEYSQENKALDVYRGVLISGLASLALSFAGTMAALFTEDDTEVEI